LTLVYYSLSVSPDGAQERQLIRSLKSLRRHNSTIPVFIFVYGSEAPKSVRREAARSSAVVTELGEYAHYLSRLSPYATALARHPCLHKLLSLRHLPTVDVSQVLYLDCDTYFLGDVEKLFRCNRVQDWYAREEPGTRRSPLGADRAHLDEDALRVIAKAEGLRRITPFNSGVWLMNNGSWRDLDRLRATFLDFVWRLLVGRCLAGGEQTTFDLQVSAAVVATATELDWKRALPCPSRSGWIVDQIALWLTVGKLTRSQGLFDRCDVVQSGEFVEALAVGGRWVVAHYFKVMEQCFWEAMVERQATGDRA
jgi:hypothetical protein